MSMKATSFLQQVDDARVVESIGRAERLSTGEIRVWVSDQNRPDALGAARTRFLKLHMERTTHRNAVLIFVAPRSRTFAVVGDIGIDQRVGSQFWSEVRDVMIDHLRAERYTEAIVHAVETAGRRLAEHFPVGRGGRNPNELPNEILGD